MNDVAIHPQHVLSLCTGYGGIELGLRLAGVQTRTICYVEREAPAAALLVEKMEAGHMDAAPVWSDLISFDGAGWRGVVDIVTAGFPCQPFSSAGRRQGIDDEQWIWPAMVGIIRDVEPGVVFLENVPPLVSSGAIADVLGPLAELRYNAEWDLFSAADVGASHKRERWFCLAYRDSGGLARIWEQMRERGLDGSPRHEPVGCGGAGEDVADTGCVREYGVQSVGLQGGRGKATSGGTGTTLDHAEGTRLADVEECVTTNDARPERTGRSLFPPGPHDADAWRTILASWPDFAPAAEPAIRRMDDGLTGGVGHWLTRHDQLRLLGNGVVPLTAALAFTELIRRAIDA